LTLVWVAIVVDKILKSWGAITSKNLCPFLLRQLQFFLGTLGD
jgi:hypothetical protein